MATANRRGDARGAYLKLTARFPLRPLRSDKELDKAVRMVDSLLDRPAPRREEADYLDVLGDLIERYEAEAYPMAPVSDAEMLRYLIETKAVSQAEVAKATGIADSTISEVLKGKRGLNRNHIGRLARYFNVSAGVFAF